MMEDPGQWPEVQEGIVSKEDAIALNDLIPQGSDAEDAQKWLPFAEMARDLCEDNEMLFGRLFLGLDPAPHMWRVWKKNRHIKKLLIRITRGAGKTVNLTIPTLIHRICYHFKPGSKYMRWSTYVGVENVDKMKEVMRAVQKPIESGGAGGLIHLAFPALYKGETMTIPEYAHATGGEWGKMRIDFTFIDGSSRKEPVLRFFTHKTSGVAGGHPDEFFFDDFVARDGAKSATTRKNVRNFWSQVLTGMVAKPHIPVTYIHTLYHEEDQSRILEKTGIYKLVEQKALDRYPTSSDYKLVLGKDGVNRVKLTAQGAKMKSIWPCPVGPDEKCPATPEHYAEVGYHRPVQEFIQIWIEDPLGFAQQCMNDPRSLDEASVKPYMMRFYTWNPNDPRIGQVASYHSEWDDFVAQANKAGIPIPEEPPKIVAFPFLQDQTDLAWSGQAWDLSYGKNVESTDETVMACRYRHRDGRVFHRFDAGRWRHGTTMKKVCLNTTTDPVTTIREVGLPGGGTESKVAEAVEDTRRQLKLDHNFSVKTFARHRSKDEVFHQSGYAAELANGLGYFDIDDHDTIRQYLSITPDETGGHDDRWDAGIYAKQLDPGGSGKGLFAAYVD